MVFSHIRTNVSSSELSTFGVGGKILKVVEVSNNDTLVQVIKKLQTRNIPFTIVAGGSNIVFPDGDYQKLVIHIAKGEMHFSDNSTAFADAGVVLDTFIEKAIEQGLGGLETLSGIPGTVGGAIVGNAGAYGKSISDALVSIKIFDGINIREIQKSEAEFSYRESIFKKKPFAILSATFLLEKKDQKTLQEVREDILFMRDKKYKKGVRCPGSFFKNVLVSELSHDQLKKIPKEKIIEGKVPSGFLLQEIGACGMESGNIYVAPFHGNLLINKGGGMYKDVQSLSNVLKKKVHMEFGISLQEEVRLLANAP